MKQITILLISIAYIVVSCSQAPSEALVTFTSEKHISVELYKPIDGACQTELVSEKFELKPSVLTDYKFSVDDFTVIFIRMQKNKIYLFLFPGDHIALHYIAESRIKITGNNAEAHTYFNNNFALYGTMAYVDQIRKLALGADNFEKMVAEAEQDIIGGVKDSLDGLRNNPEISAKFLSLLWDNLSSYLYYEIRETLRNLQYNKTLSEEEKSATLAEIEKIELKVTPPDRNTIKYPNISNMWHYQALYEKMNPLDRQELLQGYSKETFGPYAFYLLAPDYVQLPMLGDAIVVEQKYNQGNVVGFEPVDLNKTYEYLKKKYPESEYVALLAKDFEPSIQKNEMMQKDAVYYITHTVNTLSDLSKLPELKDKHLLVDFWATWCMPCHQEFSYKDKMEKILSANNNLACVYISIDEDKRDSLWKANVETLQLYGYHIRAQKQLVKDLEDKIFQSQTITIPRYILISSEGEFLDINLPNPSYGNELEKAIQKYLK